MDMGCVAFQAYLAMALRDRPRWTTAELNETTVVSGTANGPGALPCTPMAAADWTRNSTSMSAPAIAYTRILWRGWPLRATQSEPMLSDGCESASNSEGRPITQRAGSTSS